MGRHSANGLAVRVRVVYICRRPSSLVEWDARPNVKAPNFFVCVPLVGVDATRLPNKQHKMKMDRIV